MTVGPKFVELPGRVRLPYVEQGDPGGAPLVLIHGFADSLRSFELLLPHLPLSIRTIAFTQRGHGDAERPIGGYRIADLAGDLEALMDSLRIPAAFLAGASSGGLVAQRFAMDHPGRVLGLALIGSPVTLRGKPAAEAWGSAILKLSDPVDPDFVRAFVAGTVARSVPQEFVDILVEESSKLPAHVWKEMIFGLMQDDFSAELGKIEAPTLIIWGDQDAFTREDQEVLLAGIGGSERVVYPGAGHTIVAEEPKRLAADLVACTSRVC